jgi:hypothetical protein
MSIHDKSYTEQELTALPDLPGGDATNHLKVKDGPDEVWLCEVSTQRALPPRSIVMHVRISGDKRKVLKRYPASSFTA